MLEVIVVFGIVGFVMVLAGKSFYMTITGANDGCGCGTKSCSGPCRPSEVSNKKVDYPGLNGKDK